MRSILVPVRGRDGEEHVFATALAAAKPFHAHLDFYHVQLGVGEAAINAPHVGFAMGTGLAHALDDLYLEEQARSLDARDRVEKFCHWRGIALLDGPAAADAVTASWREEAGKSMPLIMTRARHSDLIVLGRPKRGDHLPGNMLDRLLLESGRPILVAPSHPVETLTATIMVCWKECREAAHAVTAAMPLLGRARRVLLGSVSEHEHDGAAIALNAFAAQLRWQGIAAEARCMLPNGGTVADTLFAAARECAADLVVMGAYSRSRIREIIFGGCTDVFLRGCDRPVLLVH